MTLPAELPHAHRLGPFLLLGPVGSGGAGEVHRAIDERNGRAVALKLLHAGAVGDRAVADRMAAEIAAVRRLDHPGIVRVLDHGVTDGRPWLAMEPLAGCTLERYARPARLLPEAVAVAVVARVAEALSAAHQRGVVHRDVKPSNVIVDWAADRVTLTDFGLARLPDAEQTVTGVVVGTPAYMAPELLGGAAPTAASDLYALGVLMFELLTGRRPHEADTLGALLQAVAAARAPALDTLRRDLPGGLSDLVAALLAKVPAHRPPDAGSVAVALRQLASPLPPP